jgi:predicted permease
VAERELRALWHQLVAENPEMAFVEQFGYRVEVESLRDNEVADLRQSLLVLQVAALLVLLVGAANLAGLTLTRLTGRSRELAVRRALGAGQRRLWRLVMVENLLLALVGALAGIGLARAALAVIEARALAPHTTLVSIHPDATVFAGGLALALLTGLLASLAPWWWLRRTALEGILRAEARGGTGGRGAQRFRAALVVGQVAVSLALAVLVGLLGASLQRLLAVDPGFASDGVLVARLEPRDEEGTSKRRQLDRGAVLDAVAALPGVQAAGIANCIPFAGCAWASSFRLPGAAAAPGEPEPTARTAQVSPGFFAALGIPMTAGRGFSAADLAAPETVVVVDRAIARRWFPGRSPLGQRLELSSDDRRFYRSTVVGVVADVRTKELARQATEPTFYPLGREHADGAYLVTRLAVTAGGADAVGAAVTRADPTTTIAAPGWMQERVRRTLSGRVAPMLLLGSFALLATLLAAVGVYAVLALAVARRRVELGVRAALGADRRRLLGMVLWQGARLVAMGLVLGVGLAFAASSLVASLLFEVGRGEATVYGAAMAALAAVGMLACWLPASHAAAIEPTLALREE